MGSHFPTPGSKHTLLFNPYFLLAVRQLLLDYVRTIIQNFLKALSAGVHVFKTNNTTYVKIKDTGR